ncbi:hypothetical protein KNCP2_07620 [Candidatus Rickettsia kedanie]|uniref:Uncharacterized protein n=1 Tax=Candidatus Rickettsia kedanie TaxID=3115352 RepID=A0ABP9TTA3_9RICK
MLKESLRILDLDKENGYYNGGQIIFGKNHFSSKVLRNFSDLIILEDIIPDYAKDTEEVKIIAGYDKIL